MNFLSFEAIGQILFVVILILLWWFAWDMRSILKFGQRKNELSIEGRWKDLENHFKHGSKTWRPFVRFYRRYLIPGTVTTQYALFLHQQGRGEEALAQVDEAIRQVHGKPKIFHSIYHRGSRAILHAALRTRTLILSEQGRYQEAREVIAELQNLAEPGSPPEATLALLEFNCGQLDEALAHAEAVPEGNQQYDTMRAVTGLALSTKGDFEHAIAALTYQPGDISKFYTPTGWDTMNRSIEGAKLVALQNKKLAGIFQPTRLLLIAGVYITQENFQKAADVLDQAEQSLGSEPAIQGGYYRQRVCSLAGQGKASEAEKCIERLRSIIKQVPRRGSIWESHIAVGRAYFYLERFKDALCELSAAQKCALHPIEKHILSYWFARTHEAAGHQQDAISYYQMTAADPIHSWMRKYAVEALARLGN